MTYSALSSGQYHVLRGLGRLIKTLTECADRPVTQGAASTLHPNGPRPPDTCDHSRNAGNPSDRPFLSSRVGLTGTIQIGEAECRQLAGARSESGRPLLLRSSTPSPDAWGSMEIAMHTMRLDDVVRQNEGQV